MKKTFNFIVSNKKPERQLDSIRHEVKKYLARERRKKLPDDMGVWQFDCRIGLTQDNSTAIHVNDISKRIGEFLDQGAESFYLEILARPKLKASKEKSTAEAE